MRHYLASVENGTDTFTYTYDFFGNRDSVTVNGTTTNEITNQMMGGGPRGNMQNNFQGDSYNKK